MFYEQGARRGDLVMIKPGGIDINTIQPDEYPERFEMAIGAISISPISFYGEIGT